MIHMGYDAKIPYMFQIAHTPLQVFEIYGNVTQNDFTKIPRLYRERRFFHAQEAKRPLGSYIGNGIDHDGAVVHRVL
jgi:hypothetical protein